MLASGDRRGWVHSCRAGSHSIITSVRSELTLPGKTGYKGGAGLLPFTATPQFRRRFMMTRRILIGGLLGAVLLLSAGLSRAQKNDAPEKAVTALESQWMKSQQT